MNLSKFFFLFISIIIFLVACATEQSSIDGQSNTSGTETIQKLPDYPSYSGYPLRVMVFPWNISKVDLEKYPHFRNLQIGFGISNRLLDELYETGQFELIEEKQAVLARMLQQMQKCTNGVCDKNYAPMDRLPTPRYIVYPEVYHVGVEKNVFITGVNARAKLQTEIGVQVNFVDTQTGITKALGSSIGKYPNTLTSSILSNKNIEFSQSALGKAAENAIKGALLKAIKRIPSNNIPPIKKSLVKEDLYVAKKTKKPIKNIEKKTPNIQQRANIIVPNKTSKASRKNNSKKSDLVSRNYHALIIGNNDYHHVDKLVTAKNDAKEIAQVLKEYYGYTIHLLYDASRQDIIGKMDELRRNLSVNDNLLIYYAGHGYLDKEADRGYWLPVNASTNNTAEWISNIDITDKVKTIQANHIMVIADSCYSGTLTRGVIIDITAKETLSDYYQRMLSKRSRTVMASGGLEPVADGGKNNHSVFAGAFLDTLMENEDVMDGTNFFNTVRRKVILEARQTPEYSDIRFAGHKGGDYLFIKK